MCSRLKVKKPADRNLSRYGDGQKYCSYCGVFMKVDKLRCPCCKKQLKTRSSSKVTREAMFNRI